MPSVLSGQTETRLLLPVRLEKDPGRADDRLAVKALEDRLMEPQAPEIRGVEDILLLGVMGEAPGD